MWRAKIYLIAYLILAVFFAAIEPVIGKQAEIILAVAGGSNLIAIVIIIVLARWRIYFADCFLMVTTFIRQLGFLYVARIVITKTCSNNVALAI